MYVVLSNKTKSYTKLEFLNNSTNSNKGENIRNWRRSVSRTENMATLHVFEYVTFFCYSIVAHVCIVMFIEFLLNKVMYIYFP